MTTMTLTERFVDCFTRADLHGLIAMYRADAVLDMNVPHWRYQVQGTTAIAEALGEAFAAPGRRVAHLRSWGGGDVVVIEHEGRFTQDGEERLWRQVDVLHLDGGQIAEHITYCTGIWDAAQIARQARDAPMVHR